MHQVLFFSRGGNTKKLAEAIAGQLGVTVSEIESGALGPADSILFLGSGCYASKPDKTVLDFIAKNNFAGRNVAIFGTSASGRGNEVRFLSEVLKGKGAKVLGSYHCTGQWLWIVRRGHPNKEELSGAQRFALEMTKSK